MWLLALQGEYRRMMQRAKKKNVASLFIERQEGFTLNDSLASISLIYYLDSFVGERVFSVTMAAGQRGALLTGDLGFTVMELIVVIVIMGIVAAVAVPLWSVLLPTFALNSAARQVQSELHRIKMQAAAQNIGYEINVPSADAKEYQVKRDSTLVAIKPLPDGITVTQVVTISFSSRGTASPNRVRLLNSQNGCVQVVVSNSGRIRTCKPNSCGGTC